MGAVGRYIPGAHMVLGSVWFWEQRMLVHLIGIACGQRQTFAGLERGTPEYEERKEQRSALLYRAVEKIIPDIRERIEISMVRRGTVTS